MDKKNTYFRVLCHGMDVKYLHGVMCLNTWYLVGDAVCEGAEVLRRQSLSGGRRPLGVGFCFSIARLHFLYHTLLLHRLCNMAAGPPDSDFWPSPTWWSILLWNCELKEDSALGSLLGISSQQQKQNEGMLCCHKEEWVPMVLRTRAGSTEPHVTQTDSQWQVLHNFFRMWNLKTFS